jgi:small subunit ribosomal protein S1
VLEFNKDTQRILLSHSRINENKSSGKKTEEAGRKRGGRSEGDDSVKKVKESIEKTTLGDIGALSDLKSQMETTANKSAKKAKPEAEASPEIDSNSSGTEPENKAEEKPNDEGQ